jgi:hypothetical protein
MNVNQLRVVASTKDRLWVASVNLRFGCSLIATLACLANQPTTFAQTNPQLGQTVSASQPTDSVHFAKSSDCALCHSFSNLAGAMRDGKDRNVAPFDLWSGSMMANSAVDPYWKAAVSAEVAATPSQKPHI